MGFGGEIDGTAEYVQNTAIDVLAGLAAEIFVQRFSTSTSQFGNLVNTEPVKIVCDGRANAGMRVRSVTTDLGAVIG